MLNFNMSKELKTRLIIYSIVLFLVCIFFTGALAVSVEKAQKQKKEGFEFLISVYDNLSANIFHPIKNLGLIIKYDSIKHKYFEYTKIAFFVLIGLIAFIEIKLRLEKRDYKNIEHGSSRWAQGEEYQILNKSKGIILGVGKYLDVNSPHINKNILVFGGAGSRKSRGFVMPNILQMLGSYVITDPKGELYDTTAGFLKANGYDVRILNLVNPDCSDTYNPLFHVRTPIDVDIISHAIIENTSGQGKVNEDPFWPQAERAILNACIYYIISQCPPEERSFASCLSLVRAGSDEELLDSLFMKLPFEHMARKSYETFRLAEGRTRSSILIGLAARLNPFDTPEIASLMATNSIDIESLGRKKMAIYVVTPDCHSTFNFITTIFFGQVLQRLYDIADKNGGSLDIPVFFLLDEFANTGRIPDFNQKISTSRSRKINISIILQSLDQLIDLYKDVYENIISNCDTQLFLGSQALRTCEYISKSLGEATIYKKTESYNMPHTGLFSMFSHHGGSVSMTKGDQSMGRVLMTVDELKRMDLWTEIILIKGLNPIKARKYDVAQHPRYKEAMMNKISHNEFKAGERGEWRIFNPYEATQDVEEEEISDEELERRFSELFNISA